MILGMNWLKTFNPQINWEKETLQFDKPGSIRENEPRIQEFSQMAVNATMSHSQCLDQEHVKREGEKAKTLEELVP
jgi:hypothetical protein